ncbi:Ribosomal RNA small subunit methyltransferase H [Candidatus Johnevansia muelleri]|uniref:Ribosomal RNA small subunit methyltransferase H n=1 Tax=Candidatus Johnevansia muelleri TaxID=1495769 RepID=A0A078KEY0_9GAMM|nr:Ribosomal RNA small subunit methyltransferase H [Candidatus Evansia muelleri]
MKHVSVLLKDAVNALVYDYNGYYLDCTFGGGGHSNAILKKISYKGKLLAIDKDPISIDYCKIKDFRFSINNIDYCNIYKIAIEKGILGKISGVLFDNGISAFQLNDHKRGFSFINNGPLDMRINNKIGITAKEWLNKTNENDIAYILKIYGEERYAKKLANAICEYRRKFKITHTVELANIIKKAHPSWEYNKHPATRTFQAIRIHLNNELKNLDLALNAASKILIKGGRIVVISFHSLEDRLVKRFINANSNKFKHLGKFRPSKNEIYINPSARSAIMRIAQKIS